MRYSQSHRPEPLNNRLLIRWEFHHYTHDGSETKIKYVLHNSLSWKIHRCSLQTHNESGMNLNTSSLYLCVKILPKQIKCALKQDTRCYFPWLRTEITNFVDHKKLPAS